MSAQYDLEMQQALSAVGWQGRLNEASTAEEVVSVVRDYLALWTPEELGALPEACRPGKIVDADDVAAYAVQMARSLYDHGLAPGVAKLANFITNASLRLSQILARSSEVSSEDG